MNIGWTRGHVQKGGGARFSLHPRVPPHCHRGGAERRRRDRPVPHQDLGSGHGPRALRQPARRGRVRDTAIALGGGSIVIRKG